MKPLATRAARVARPLAAMVAAAALTLAAALAGAAPATAHEGGGTFTVEQSHATTGPEGASAYHYIVRLTWDNDGHAAEGSTVTATAIDAAGTAQTPVTLAPDAAGDGRYSGAVPFPTPGAWTVRFTSIEPTGSLDQAQEVAPPATTTTAPPSTAADDTGEDASATTGDTTGAFAPADDGTGDSAQPAASTADGDDDGDSIPVLLIVGAAVVALGGVVTALLAVRRYRPDAATAGAETASAPATAAAGDDESTAAAGDAPEAGTTAAGDADATPGPKAT